MPVFDTMLFAKYKSLQSSKENILNHLKLLTNKIFIFCVYSEYELIVDLFNSLHGNILVFPVYTLNDYYNIFHSFMKSDISTSVDYYIIMTNDTDLDYLIKNTSRLVSLSEMNGVLKLSHNVQYKEIYCVSYDLFIALFKNIIVRPNSSPISDGIHFREFLTDWQVFES